MFLAFVIAFNTMVPPLNVIHWTPVDVPVVNGNRKYTLILCKGTLGIASNEYDKDSLLTCISVEHLLIYIFWEI